MAMLASLFRLIEAAFEPCDASSQDPQSQTGHSMEHSKERRESKERPALVSSCSASKASRQQLAWPGSRTESLRLA